MKTLKIFSALLVLSLISSSCDEVKDLVEFDLDFSLEETFNIVGEDGMYTASKTINALDDGNISGNIDNIKNYEVEKMSITVTNLVADLTSANISNLELKLTDPTGDIIVSSPVAINLETLQAVGKTDLNLDADTLERIKAMIVAGDDITLTGSATVGDGPASFDLTISIDGKITIGA